MNYKQLLLPIALAIAGNPARANIQFNLIPEPGTTQQAIDGFTAAANLWSATLANNVTVNIQIGFAALGTGIIGQTSVNADEWSYPALKSALAASRVSANDYSSYAGLQPGATYNRLINHTSNNPNGPNSAIPYVDTMNRVGLTTANAKALGLLGTTSSLDALIRFSSAFPFDFNHNGPIDPAKFDFVGAAAHEIGHALGFFSGVDDIDTLNGAYAGGGFSSNLLDLFRYSTESLLAGPGYTDYTADPRQKYFSVDGGNTLTAQFSTGAVFGDGRQASHWKDNLGLGLMDPTATYGEQLDLSYTDLRAFDVMGYTLVPEPATSGLFVCLALAWLVVRRCWPNASAVQFIRG